MAWLAAAVFLGGCTPLGYRMRADQDAYGIIAENTQGPSWTVPPFSIDAPRDSRNFDPFRPDGPPMPPDDPAAHAYMHCVGGHAGYRCWHQWGDAAEIESQAWRESLQLTDKGKLALSRDRAVELGLLHSREYQFELENLYLAALGVSLERFSFQLQWFGGNTTTADFLGSRLSARGDQSSLLRTTSRLGFNRAFTTGGQLVVDAANTFVWEFSGANTTQSLSTLSIGVIQPLLRGAFRDIRMEPLTQSERSMLYAARDYARFRKQFYFDLSSGTQGYLGLLVQLQAIRNLESNLVSLERNLREHEALAQAGIISVLRVDQVFQSYQSGRLRLIRANNDLQTALDAYKIRMGLPPELDAELDDSLLKPFELNSPEITRLQGDLENFLASFRELPAAPDTQRLTAGWKTLQTLHRRTQEQYQSVLADWQSWSDQAAQESTAPDSTDDPARAKREIDTRRALKQRLDELDRDLTKAAQQLAEEAAGVSESKRVEDWEAIQAFSRRASTRADDLFVIQSQIRAYLIQLQPVRIPREEAIPYALENRLDLMNRRAEVVDAWRHVHVAENALRADLDVFSDVVVGTAPGANPVRFSSDSSSARVGIRFDSPLNRFVERNIYRTEQVEYQRARRAFLASRDAIVQAVRLDLRSLDADRLNFEIARQSLIAAARQVELAKIQLSAPKLEGDSSSTQDALNALNSLLEAKNALIAVWVSYETNRLRLSLDTEALQLDERGLPQNEDSPTSATSRNEFAADGDTKAFLGFGDTGGEPSAAADKPSAAGSGHSETGAAHSIIRPSRIAQRQSKRDSGSESNPLELNSPQPIPPEPMALDFLQPIEP